MQAGTPKRSLRGFVRTAMLAPGQSQQVRLQLQRSDFALASLDGTVALKEGVWEVSSRRQVVLSCHWVLQGSG